ncbi:MAG: hypothetical protein AAF629_01925 [Chloroflexota bacterium]
MIKNMIAKQLDKQEQDFGVSLDYVRHILNTSLPAFFKFGMFMPLAQHRRSLPPEAFAVARIVATRDEDCGTCVQLEVNQAQKTGTASAILQAILNDTPDDLPLELATVYHFTQAVIGQTGTEDQYRTDIVSQWGEEALVELALAIASARAFPIIKRSLGYATRCSLVEIQVKDAA